MEVTTTALKGVIIIEPDVYGDERGFFLETYNLQRYQSAGINAAFVQDNHSRSTYGVLRGLHFQRRYPQGKLVRVVRGEVWDVAVDIDPSSDTYTQYVGVRLSDENKRQLYIPPGYAHGFCVLSKVADLEYKCTDVYHADDEVGVFWNDPEIAIDWPIERPMLSDRDRANRTLVEINAR